MKIPIYDIDNNTVGYQLRRPGSTPLIQPRGLPLGECKPYIERLHDRGILLVCEGPTDAIFAGELEGLSEYSIIGAWSSTTLPSRDWWFRECNIRTKTVVACGDNDLAGKAFNQRIANIAGSCYELYWPPNRYQKWDVKDELEKKGLSSLQKLISVSLCKQPLVAAKKQEKKYTSTYRESTGVIEKMILDAGGRFAFPMTEGGSKWYCPLHNDREDASLTANDRTGSWMCWAGCGKGGPIQFLMAWKQCSYKNALELMREYVS